MSAFLSTTVRPGVHALCRSLVVCGLILPHALPYILVAAARGSWAVLCALVLFCAMLVQYAAAPSKSWAEKSLRKLRKGG